MTLMCQRCGLPIFDGAAGYAGPQCRCWVYFKPAPNAADNGAHVAPRPLTEADVRRIVREELAAREAGTTAGN